MPFNSETALESYVRRKIQKRYSGNNNISCFDSKSIVDITILRNDPPQIFFIEAKLYKPTNNRINIGKKDGSGIQTEILDRRPIYLNKYLRWLIARDDRDGFLFLSSEVVHEFIYEGITRGQQNNIQPKVFEHNTLLSEIELFDEIDSWLGS